MLKPNTSPSQHKQAYFAGNTPCKHNINQMIVITLMPALRNSSSVGRTLSCNLSSTPVTQSSSISLSKLSMTADTRDPLSVMAIRAALYRVYKINLHACTLQYLKNKTNRNIIGNAMILTSQLLPFAFRHYLLVQLVYFCLL